MVDKSGQEKGCDISVVIKYIAVKGWYATVNDGK